MENVFLGCPHYGGNLTWDVARRIFREGTQDYHLHLGTAPYSLLNLNCNRLWCLALNQRATLGLKWFAMLHSDIVPEQWWIDRMIAIAQKHDADFLSAVVPHKGTSGKTSTAIAHATWTHGSFSNLTMAQVSHPDFPDTFDIHGAADALERLPGDLRVSGVPRVALFANTGCMVCRVDKPWSEKVFFQCMDGIKNFNGEWQPLCISEDWMFSNRIAMSGGKVMCTRLIALQHWGQSAWESPRPA